MIVKSVFEFMVVVKITLDTKHCKLFAVNALYVRVILLELLINYNTLFMNTLAVISV